VISSTTLDLGAELEQRVTQLWWRLSHEVPSDLSRTAASILAMLHTEGPQRVTTLACHEHVAQPSMSLLVQRLERRGLVARADDPDDRRACRIAITAAGEQVLQERADGRSRWLRERLDRLGTDQRTAIFGALTNLDQILDDGATR
jgi:DNA-binding MarR family transcriptional regulator